MNMTSFSFPTATLFGVGALRELPSRLERVGIRKPLVVTDGGLVTTGAFRALEEILDTGRSATSATKPGLNTSRSATGATSKLWALYSGVHPNPIEQDVREAAEVYRKENCDGVVGIGGGSALDVAKAARLLVKLPELDFGRFYEVSDWSGLAPFIAIPTTAGTGSEVGRSSVITLKATGRKSVLFNPALLAGLVVLDPDLTVELPPKLTAATGADALTHCIESFTCPAFHPMCEGIHRIVQFLPRAYRNGKDIEARGNMLVAAAMGGIAFQKDLGVVHSLAHPLSTVCGMHHGLANALCLVAGMKFCAARKPGLYRRVGIACGLNVMTCGDSNADQQTIEFVGGFLQGLGLSGKLREHGVKTEQLDVLSAQAYEDPCHKTNAVPVTAGELKSLYQDLF
jgi:4-hydroxybutyrate dehydrogenase